MCQSSRRFIENKYLLHEDLSSAIKIIIMMRENWLLGFLGFIGLEGIVGLIKGDWIQTIWLLWFVWFYYFMPISKKK